MAENENTLGYAPMIFEKGRGLFAGRPVIYICLILGAILVASVYKLRTDTIFACQADGYSADRYVAYCNGTQYGEYEHGAFQFDLEPTAEDFARNADVLFIGNSRLQVGFSTTATANWFSETSARYYLLGFSYSENVTFLEPILHKMRPRAKAFVINVDDFFDRTETAPVRVVFHDPSARSRYEGKRFWQPFHEAICKRFHALCGNGGVIFRSRETGIYERRFPTNAITPVSYDWAVNSSVVNNNTDTAIKFLSNLNIKDQKCVILTMVPTVDTKIGNVSAIASALGLVLVTPAIQMELLTYDGSHLDRTSAEYWSQAFFQAADSKIRSCLEQHGVAGP